MPNERRLHNWRTPWKSQRDRLRKYAHTLYNQCHHRSPATRRAFAFPEPEMTQMILGWLFMVAILGAMVWLAYRSESRGEKEHRK